MGIWDQAFEELRRPHLEEGEKMAKKDYDKDGKVETGSQEYLGSRDNAIKKAMGKCKKCEKDPCECEKVEEGYKEIDMKKLGRMNTRAKDLRKKAMDYASREGEAAGSDRRKLGTMNQEISKASQKLRTKKEEVEALDEVAYSATAARSGQDIGKPGKQFAKIAKSAAKRYGSEERGKKVAGAVLAKLRAKNEHSDWRSDLDFFTEADCESGSMKPKKGIKNKITINPEIKTEAVTGGPVMKPGSGLGGGKPVYPDGQEPKKTGAKLPQLPLVNSYDPMEDPEFDHDEAERTRGQSGKNKSIGGKNKKTRKEEVEQIDENPMAGLAIRAGLAAGTALAGKAVYDKAKGVAGKIQQQNAEKKKQIDTLLQRNSFEPEGEEISEREMTSSEMSKEKRLKNKYDPSNMKASMKKQYGPERGEQVYFATIRKKAMEQFENKEFAGNYEGPLYAPHPDIEEGYKEIDREKETRMYRRAGNLARTALSSTGNEKQNAMKKSGKIVSAITRQKEKERFDRIGQSPKHNEAAEAELDYYLGEMCGPKHSAKKKSKLQQEAEKILERMNDEPGERDDRPDVKAHNKAVGYKPRPRRPRPQDDPRYGTMQDKSGKWKY